MSMCELRFMGHTLRDNRYDLIASAVITTAAGHAERETAKFLIAEAKQAAPDKAQITQGADKVYDAAEFIGPIRQVIVRGLKKADQLFVLKMTAYKLTRMRMRTLKQIPLQTR